MKDFEREFSDFVADYNLDVYDSADIGNGNFRFDCVIVESGVNEFKAKLRAVHAVKAANELWDDCQIKLVNFKVIEKSEDELDFSIIVNFVDESEKAEEEKLAEETGEAEDVEKAEESDDVSVQDELKRIWTGSTGHREEVGGSMAEVDAGDDYDYKVFSDISGKEIFDEYVWRIKDTDQICSTAEAIEYYKKLYKQREVEPSQLPEEVTQSKFYEPNKKYYTDAYQQMSDDIESRYYTMDEFKGFVEGNMWEDDEHFEKIYGEDFDDYYEEHYAWLDN